MSKTKQLIINGRVEDAIAIFNDRPESDKMVLVGRLRSCSATVWETNDFYVLKSYSTIIALIDKGSDYCYDFLRWAYGYTSTSAQHICKFCSDYGSRSKVYTWREV